MSGKGFTASKERLHLTKEKVKRKDTPPAGGRDAAAENFLDFSLRFLYIVHLQKKEAKFAAAFEDL